MSVAAVAEKLGERLKQARLNQNLTQAEGAESTGASRRQVMNAEKGKLVTIEDAPSFIFYAK